jgi:hypothetical protein
MTDRALALAVPGNAPVQVCLLCVPQTPEESALEDFADVVGKG